MVLDSQRNSRGGSGAFISSGRRARRRRNMIVAGTGLAVLAVVGWFWFGDAEPTDESMQPGPGAVAIPSGAGGVPVAGRDAVRLNEMAGIGALAGAERRGDVYGRDDAGGGYVAGRGGHDGVGGVGGVENSGGAGSSSLSQAASQVGSAASGRGASTAEVSLDNRAVAQLTDSRSVAANFAPQTQHVGGQGAVIEARSLQSQNKMVEARDLLNNALRTSTSPAEREAARAELAVLNERMVFSREVVPGDTYSEWYVIKSGDLLSKIAKRYQVTDDFLAHINRIPNKNAIRAGDRIKVVKGPFHAQVDKSEFRLDLYLGDAPGDGLYVRSFRVGLGADSGTPLGTFQVRNKLKNPEWVNPRTGVKVFADDPANPIGERWIGLQGIDDNTASLRGYGIHGTIEPESIGTEASMGCIRMHSGDVELVYSMMIDGLSRLKIEP